MSKRNTQAWREWTGRTVTTVAASRAREGAHG